MHWTRNRRQKCLTRSVQTQYFDSVADFEIGVNQLTHCLWRTAIRWGETTDDVKYMQGGPRCR